MLSCHAKASYNIDGGRAMAKVSTMKKVEWLKEQGIKLDMQRIYGTTIRKVIKTMITTNQKTGETVMVERGVYEELLENIIYLVNLGNINV